MAALRQVVQEGTSSDDPTKTGLNTVSPMVPSVFLGRALVLLQLLQFLKTKSGVGRYFCWMKEETTT